MRKEKARGSKGTARFLSYVVSRIGGIGGDSSRLKLGTHLVTSGRRTNMEQLVERLKDPLMQRLFLCLNSDGLNGRMEKFLNANCGLWSGTQDDFTEEQDLKQYELYQTYSSMIEEALEGFAEDEGMGHAELMKRCRAASAEDDLAKSLLDMLISASEYNLFAVQMSIMRHAQKLTGTGPPAAAGESKSGGDDGEAQGGEEDEEDEGKNGGK